MASIKGSTTGYSSMSASSRSTSIRKGISDHELEAGPRNLSNSRMALLNLMVTLSSPAMTIPVTENDATLAIVFELIFQLASPIGLMANLASVVSVADRWRMQADGITVPELWWVILLNCFALAFGCLANIVLFLHMQLWLTRSISLIITSVCYFTATVFYMALFGVSEHVYFHGGTILVHRTEGYWHGVIASCLYFLAATLIMVHTIYFCGREWRIESSKRQNMLMRLCIVYIVWIGGGAAVFQAHTLIQISYADAVYFCVVTSMTMGYGDIVPKNNLSKALVIPYVLGGILWGGLVTYNVFQSSVAKAATRSVSAAVEYHRLHALEDFHEKACDNQADGEKISFDTVKAIRRRAKRRARIVHTCLVFTWLPVFWLIGALIFKFTENWRYFDSFYMCFISLTTVGYGDFTPSSTGGRSLFVYWALVALPTMTVAVSNLTNLLRAVPGMLPPSVQRTLRLVNNAKHDEMAQEVYHKELAILTKCLPSGPVWDKLVKVIESDRGEEFDFDTWRQIVMGILKYDTLPADFWLSNNSPLRVSGLDERKFLLFAATHLLYTGF